MCTAPLDGVPFWDSKVYFIKLVYSVLENLAKVPQIKKYKSKNDSTIRICLFIISLVDTLVSNEIYMFINIYKKYSNV